MLHLYFQHLRQSAVRAALISGIALSCIVTAAPVVAALSDQFPTNATSSGTISEVGRYSVVQGDTLFGISRRFKTRVETIKELNGMVSDIIAPGMVLSIPGIGGAPASPPGSPPLIERSAPVQAQPTTDYMVKAGDTLFRISRELSVDVVDLVRLNGMKSGDRLFVGQRLKTPGAAQPQKVSTPNSAPTLTPGSLQRQTLTPTGTAPSSFGAERPTGSKVTSLEIPRPVAKPIQIASLKPTAATETIVEKQSPSTSVKPLAVPDLPKTAALKPKTEPSPAANNSGDKLLWPIRGQLLATYGLNDNGVKVDGITIAVDAGDPILAADNGTVMYTGDALSIFGQLILVKHKSGLITAYAHNERIAVKKGEEVKRGEVIAYAGNTGEATRPQLHFQVRKDGKPVDPLPFLAR